MPSDLLVFVLNLVVSDSRAATARGADAHKRTRVFHRRSRLCVCMYVLLCCIRTDADGI